MLILYNKVQKSDFWNELILYINSLQSPYLVIGDFNEITNSSDKLGGAIYSQSRAITLSNFFDNVCAVEFPFIGPQFTWRKKKLGSNNLF